MQRIFCTRAGLLLAALSIWITSAQAAPSCHIDTPPPKTPEQLALENVTWGSWQKFEERYVRIDSAAAPTPTYHVLMKRPGALPNVKKPLVVFLHGFPEFAWSWENWLDLIGTQHDAIAIDLKGFGDSSKPTDLAPYDLFRVTREIDNIASCLGYKQVIPVGHDWGGTFAWLYTMLYPLKTRALVVLSTPHPYTFSRELAKPNSEQRKLSHYIELVRQNTPESTAAFKAELNQNPDDLLLPFYPGARALRLYQTNMDTDWKWDRMFSYYRVMDFPPSPLLYSDKTNLLTRTLFKIRVPTLAFYGTADPYFSPVSWQGMAPFIPQLDLRPLQGRGHFINHEVPELPQQVLDYINAQVR